VQAFEAEFALYVGVTHCVGVANATDGLTLALRVLGVGKGDEVITTPFTAIPTLSAIVDAGATPVFVDVDPNTFCMNIELVPSKITSRTKAIMPVHIFGNMVDIVRLRQICGTLPIVEDASQAHGSKWNDAKAGSMSDLGVFSFYPTKNLGAYGDGGAVVTSNDDLNRKLRLMRMYGMVDKDHIESHGVNSRLDELQAAILRVKLRDLDDMNDRRNVLARRYRERLRADRWSFQKVDKSAYSNCHVFVARYKGDREALMAHLEANDIQTNIYYPIPLHLQGATRALGGREGDFPNVERLCREVVALPLYPEFPEALQARVIQAINAFESPHA